jgi:hypothetical protein
MPKILWGPNYNAVTLDTVTMDEYSLIMPLPVGGYLLAVNVQSRWLNQSLPVSEHGNYRAQFTIYDSPDLDSALGSFRWQNPARDCGIAFPVPVPNVNASRPCYIVRNEPRRCPTLTITVIHLLQGEVNASNKN